MKKNSKHDIQAILKAELEFRKKQDPKYSLRNFAEFLNIDRTSLSNLLSGKTGLSESSIRKVAVALKLNETELCELLGKEQDTKPYEDEFVSLSHHEIEILSKWYFVAILCLAQFKDNHSTPEWVTSKINILKTEAKEALDLLVKLNFIKIENEKMIETKNSFQHKSTVPSEQIRNYHKMNLNLAEYAIDNFHMNERILGSISVPTNKKQLVKVLPIVEKFKIDMANALGVKEPQDVYTVAVQVFPVTK